MSFAPVIWERIWHFVARVRSWPLRRLAARVLTGLFLAWAASKFCREYFNNGGSPTNHPFFAGWLADFDQSKYYEAARAWYALDLAPERHYYLPGYPMMAAPFVGLLGVHAFFPVNLASLLAVCYFVLRTCDELRLSRIAGLFALLVSVIWQPAIRIAYAMPWSSTPVAALEAAIVFLFLKADRSRTDFVLMGILGGLIPMIRPLDLLPLAPIYLFLAGEALYGLRATQPPAARRLPRLGDIAACVGGGAAALAVGVLSYSAVHGLSPSPYISISTAIGSEYSQALVKFYAIFIDPISIYTAGDKGDCEAILHRMPWMLFGFCGVVAAILQRNRLSAVALWIVLHIVVYVSYTDLIPTGVWRFWNIHYFKPILPFLALLAWTFVAGFAERESWKRHLGIAVAAMVLSSLHLDLVPLAIAQSRPRDNRGFELVLSETAPVKAIDIPGASADFPEVFWRGARLTVDGTPLRNYGGLGFDLRAVPAPWGVRIVLLEPHKGQRFTGQLLGKVALPADYARFITASRLRLGFGWPRWWWPESDRKAPRAGNAAVEFPE